MLAVVVGRFQVVDTAAIIELRRVIHGAHEGEQVIVLVESSPARNTRKNPLDFDARKAMLNASWPEAAIIEIMDMADPERWSEAIDALIAEHADTGDGAALYPCGESSVALYSGAHFVVTGELITTGFAIADRQMRGRAAASVRSTEDFRAGMVHAAAVRYPAVFATVDVAIFNESNDELLMARKPGETLLRFVGGFADPGSASYEDDASREAVEETGLVISPPKYVGSMIVDDWRYRSEVDKIKTMLFRTNIVSGEPLAQDDIAELRWVNLSDVLSNADELIVPEHQGLVAMLAKALNLEAGRN